jgi:preprotein translocase subunit SecG
MGLFHFLIVVQAIIAAALVGVILMQRSEGGGLGGGSPGGLMSARGQADFLTRMTAVLGTAFIIMCIALAVVSARSGGSSLETEAAETSAPAKTSKTEPASKAAPATTDKAPAPKGTEVPLDK